MKYLALLQSLAEAPATSPKGTGNSLTKPTEPESSYQRDSVTKPTEPTEPILSVLTVSDPSVSNSDAVVTPNSRTPPVSDAVRTVIEGDARAQGWPAELRWNAEFWGSPRGLAAVLDESDAISEVTADYVAIVKTERRVLKFLRTVS